MLWRLLSREHIEDYLHGDEPWAVVTGSTDGIGKATANVLLSKGFNVLLHGRTPSKVASVQSELQSLHPKQKVFSVLADFSDTSPSSLNIIPTYLLEHSLSSKVNIFVNNVAATDASLGVFINGEADSQERTKSLMTGVVYFTELCARVVPMMLQGSDKKRRKLVVNVGSAAGQLGMPFVAVYAATKGYMLTLTRSLALETRLLSSTKPNGLSFIYADVHAVRTGGNPTPSSFFVPTAEAFAESLVSAISRRKFWSEKRGGGVLVTPYWTHGLEVMMLRFAPRRVIEAMAGKRMMELKDVLKEREKAKAKAMEENTRAQGSERGNNAQG